MLKISITSAALAASIVLLQPARAADPNIDFFSPKHIQNLFHQMDIFNRTCKTAAPGRYVIDSAQGCLATYMFVCADDWRDATYGERKQLNYFCRRIGNIWAVGENIVRAIFNLQLS